MPEPEPPDIQALFRLHIDASKRLRDLLREGERLRDAGKIDEARSVLRQAEEIEATLREIEAEFKPHRPSST